METEKTLGRKVKTAEDLHSVVKTMKTMAAVSIRQFEDAVEALADYSRTVELALQVVLRKRSRTLTAPYPGPNQRLGAVIFGSDQGMCGQLNDEIASHTLRRIDSLETGRADCLLLVLGSRLAWQLEDAGYSIEDTLPMPRSTPGITPLVQDVLLKIENWYNERDVDRVYLFYNKHLGGAYCRPESAPLLPVDDVRLEQFEKRQWPTRSLPTFRMEWDSLFSALINEYLFVYIFRAFAESLASEYASRLASMQGAERNIEEQIAELTSEFHQLRQMTITEELLDIAAGFEALTRDPRY